jgi:hypothetical protein
MVGLLMSCGQIGGNPWEGKNARCVQGLTTGPYHIPWAGGNLRPGPRPRAAQIHTRAARDLVAKPPRAGRGQDDTARVGTAEAVALPALLVPQPLEGMGVAHVTFPRPAVAIRAQERLGAQGQLRGDKGLNRRRWLAWPRRFGAARGLAPPDHDLAAPPGQHRGPQPPPRVHLGARPAGLRCPARRGRGPSLGRAEPVAWFARGAAALVGRLWGQRLELGADRDAAHRLDRIGPGTDRGLGGITAVGHGPAGAPGPLRSRTIEAVAGELTTGPRRDVTRGGWLGCAREGEADRDAQAMAGPPREGERPGAEDAVHAPKRPVLWAGGAGAMAGPVAAVELAASFLLGSIVNDAPQALVLGAHVGGPADDGAPELPSSGIAGATEEDSAS